MPRFFTETIDETKGIITGDDAKHIAKVLRMKASEKLVACDCQGRDYDCVISEVCDKQVELTVEKVYPSETEPSVMVTLYQAMPKSDKMELIIQKAVELGVSAIVPVQTKRCVSRPDAKSMAKKLERYNRIALEAAKQCGRGRIPQVLPMLDYSEALTAVKADERAFLFYENSTSSFRKELEQTMKSMLSALNERQQRILRLHFGMEDGTCYSLEEIGKLLGISKERTRQIERQAMDKLQKMGATMGLEDFLSD